MVTSSFTRGGVIVQVTDGGLGIADDTLAELNEKLRAGGEVTPDTARRMGLFVVSRLAQRHGLTVQLDQNDRMGITATVFLPTSVLSDTARLEAGSGGGAQVIELGATQAVETEDHDEYDEHDVDAEVVAYRRPDAGARARAGVRPHHRGHQRLRPAAAPSGCDRCRQRQPGGVHGWRLLRPGRARRGRGPRCRAGRRAHDRGLGRRRGRRRGGRDRRQVDAHAEEERAPIALGPVTETHETDEVTAEAEVEAEVEVDEVDEADEVAVEDTESDDTGSEDAEEHLEQVAEADDQDDADEVQDDADDEADDHLAPVLATLPLNPSVPFDAEEAAAELSHALATGQPTGQQTGTPRATGRVWQRGCTAWPRPPGASASNGLPTTCPSRLPPWSPPSSSPVSRLWSRLPSGSTCWRATLNGAGRTPASMDEDETPIFRSLRSNWLSSDSGERPWANSEVDAGWDAADRVEATPPTRQTETGLPVRRPGNRLIPGGLSTPAPVQTVRDPEAIRARLAAHAAGVSRGRNAAGVTDTTTQEADPA